MARGNAGNDLSFAPLPSKGRAGEGFATTTSYRYSIPAALDTPSPRGKGQGGEVLVPASV